MFWGHIAGIQAEDAGGREVSVIEQAHRQSVRVSPSQAAALLQEILSRRLTAYIVGVKDGKTVSRWAKGDISSVRQENERRLRTAYEVVELLTQFDSPETVRAWFIGLNPQLDDESPADALHEGRLREVLGAARAFVAGG